ncbi:MAG: metallophosphoesterase family protein [Prolixibacteraceae bacterium]
MMIKIGLISDTHSTISPRTLRFLEPVDELWHAGDIGSVVLADQLARFKPFRAVHGNIDDQVIRRMFPETLRFSCEQVDVLMTHIGGSPGRYDRQIRNEIHSEPPGLFICGHSHILKVMFDKKNNFLYINPGAAGNQGFHHVCTALRFSIDAAVILDLEVLEFERSAFYT